MTSSAETAHRDHTIPDLAVVIPALNEYENLSLLLPALHQTIAGLGIRAEIVVVDGGSSDLSVLAAQRNAARVLCEPERGYGAALLAGFAATTAPYIVTMDADLSHRPVFIEALWERREQADMLIASRYVPGGQAQMPMLRRALSQILNRVYRRMLSLPVSDLSSGYRMYRREVLAGLRPVARDFDLLEELLIRVHAEGWRIGEVPFHYMPRGSGTSHTRLLRLGWAFLRTLLRMWKLRNSINSADYDYRALNSPIWLQRYWQRTRYRTIFDFLQGRDHILDVGCGSSRIILDLPRAVGLDILERKLRWLRPRHTRVLRATCHRLPFPHSSFDTVICSEVIEHVPDSPEVLGEMTRVLRLGGLLVLGTPDYGRLSWRLLEWMYHMLLPGGYADEHVTHFTHKELSRRLELAGYKILDCRYVGFSEMIFKARKVSE